MSHRPKPFVGYEGIGCRLSIQGFDSLISIEESLSSQIVKILFILFFSISTSFAIWSQWSNLGRHPKFVIFSLMSFCALGWLVCVKFFYNLLGRRRIEIHPHTKEILLFEAGSYPSKRYLPDEIKGTEILISDFRPSHRNRIVENFTIRLLLKDETRNIDLCTSDRRDTIEEIKNRLDALVPGLSKP